MIVVVVVFISMNRNNILANKQANKEYEQYLNQKLYGTDVATIINKAINENRQNQVEKDKKGNYIDNEENSIRIDIIMITNEEKKKTKTYQMENIAKVGIAEFITNFNTAPFQITKMEYHPKTGKIRYIEITQQYEW